MNNPKEADLKETLVSFADQISTLMTKYYHKELDFDAVNTHSVRYQDEALAAILEQFEKDVLEIIGPDYDASDFSDGKTTFYMIPAGKNEEHLIQRQRLTALLEQYRKGGLV